jgi:hypothetical protein
MHARDSGRGDARRELASRSTAPVIREAVTSVESDTMRVLSGGALRSPQLRYRSSDRDPDRQHLRHVPRPLRADAKPRDVLLPRVPSARLQATHRR